MILKNKHKKLALVLAILFIALVAFFMMSFFVSQQNVLRVKNDLSMTNDLSGSGSHREVVYGPKITNSLDPDIAPIIQQLKDIERNRYTHCREWEDGEKIIHEFLMGKLPVEDELKMNQIIAGAKGYTENEYKNIITWQQKLRDDYLPIDDCECYIVTISFRKDTMMGEFSIIGVPRGGLIMREGNIPFCEKPLLRPSELFRFDSNWRFSHLVNLD